MSMMCLGQFIFDLKSAPYQSLAWKFGWRHPASARVGLRPARQYIGPDDETMTLSGVLLPEFAGDPISLNELRQMADEGEAYVLVDGNGGIAGRFVIESIEETRTIFFQDGTARQIDFSLSLARADDDDIDVDAMSSRAGRPASDDGGGEEESGPDDDDEIDWGDDAPPGED
jgi:phage protein U